MWDHRAAGERCGRDHSGNGSYLDLGWGCCYSGRLSAIVDRFPIYTDMAPINGIPILGFWGSERNSAQR